MKALLSNKRVKETIGEFGTVIICTGSIVVFFAEVFNWMTTI